MLPENDLPTNHEQIEPRRVALAAMVHYPNYGDKTQFDHVRAEAALISIRAAREAGYQFALAISDTTPQAFVDVLPKGTAYCRRSPGSDRLDASNAAVMIAHQLPKTDFLVYLQAEKNLAKLLPLITAPFSDPTVDFVIPTRETTSFETGYPDFQFKSETEANLILHQLLCQAGLRQATDPALDLMFGVSAYRTKPGVLGALLGTYRVSDRPDKPYHELAGLGVDVISAARLLKEGHRVAAPEICFRMPPEMIARETSSNMEEMLNKRRKQAGIITGRLAMYLASKLEEIPDPLLIKGPPLPRQC